MNPDDKGPDLELIKSVIQTIADDIGITVDELLRSGTFQRHAEDYPVLALALPLGTERVGNNQAIAKTIRESKHEWTYKIPDDDPDPEVEEWDEFEWEDEEDGLL